MDHEPVGRFEHAGFTAEIYSTSLPGEFKICYRDGAGESIAEEMLSGVSTYRQREPEIKDKLKALSEGKSAAASAGLADSGEY